MRRRGRRIDLAAGLDAVARRIDPAGGETLKQVAVAVAWEKVAGERVLAHTTGAHLRDGEMLVSVDSPAWATELSAMTGPYIERMNEELGKELVRGMRFTVSRSATLEARTALSAGDEIDEATPAIEPVPLSEIERAQVVESVSAIEDDELREAALRVTVADLEWKKGLAAAKDREGGSDGP